MPRHSSPRALRLAVFVMLALFSLPLVSASAQDATEEPEPYEEKVAALLCVDRSCLEFGPRIPGFTINVVDINSGDLIDSCVTDAATEYEGCLVTIPADAQWTLSWDDSQIPEGYEYRGSLMGVSGGAFGSITYVGFIPLEDEPTPAPDPEWEDLSVAAVLCEDSDCEEFGDRLGDVTITAVDSHTRETLSMCTTTSGTETGTCQLEVPVGADLEFIADEENIPEGYTFFGSIITIEDGPHGPITYLPFVTEDDAPDPTVTPTAPPVKALPSTGTVVPDSSESSNLGSITLAIVTVVLAGAALHLRRR